MLLCPIDPLRAMSICSFKRSPLAIQLFLRSILDLRQHLKLRLLSLALPVVMASPSNAQNSSVLLDFSLPRSGPAAQNSPARRETALNFTPPKSENPSAPESLANSGLITSYAEEKPIANSKGLPVLAPQIQALFRGGPDSVVARAVGSAEGTRSPNGDRTWAYHGHRDPGNGHWNLGSFSYQHGATSPAEADEKQLKRLENQARQLQQLARQKQLTLSITEALNGIDLANQAPLAALDRGYIDRLEEARQLSLGEAEGILHARTWSYWDPDLDRWDAPGLGNQWLSISEDQRRRQEAIAQTLALEVLEPGNAIPKSFVR